MAIDERIALGEKPGSTRSAQTYIGPISAGVRTLRYIRTYSPIRTDFLK